MDLGEIQQQVYRSFLLEAPELIHKIEQELLDLLQEHSVERVHNLMRYAHTLKGAAASVERQTLQTLAHHLEEVFKCLYQPETLAIPELGSLLLDGFEHLRLALQAELTHTPINDEELLNRAAATFAQLQYHLGDAYGQDEMLLSSADLGFDVVGSLFQETVLEELNHLAAVLDTGDGERIRQAFLQQGEFFLGLAESYGLPGLGAIAAATLAALQAHPEQTLIIAELALEDYRQARQAILNGDRERGGDPSPLLLALAQEQLAPPVQAEAEGVSLAQVQAVLQEVEAELQAEKLDRPPPRVPGPAQPSSPDPVLLPPMIRVEVQHLEQLSQVLGELLVDHNQYRQTQQHTQQQIRETLVLLEQAQAQLEQVRDWIRRDPGRSAPAPFDALELDAYGELHGAVESLGEALGQMEERLRAWQGQQTGLELKRRKRLLDQAQGALLQMRMVPVGTVLQRFFRVLEQLQVAHGKAVQLTVRGSELLVDKSLVEKLYDPLLHLVRNAFDHGIEPASERQKQGKPPTGRISIAACRQGNRTLIEVSDDGKGLDWERIRQRAIQRGLLNPEIQPSQEQLQEFLFQPGFSTVAQVNQLSGRGVGLNVVRSQIQSLQGSITIRSQPGQGTTFRLHLPLTLSTERLLICRCNGIPYALLTDGIVQLIIPEQIQHYQGFAGEQQAISWGEGWLPIRTLGSPVAPARSPLILLGSQEPVVALAVDEIVAEQDLVVKPLPPRPTPPPYALGYSFLSEGQLCLVVDPQVWLGSSPPAPPPSLPPSVGSRPWVLVVDDSLTQRVSLSQMLADAGYRVLQAGDGLEALQLCQEHRDLSLILCDIEMPQMNGFEFLQARQQNPKLQGIPVVMVTSRAGQKHRDYAVRLGADGYLIKPVVAAELWQILSQLGVVV